MDKVNYLRKVDLFAGLSDDELRACEAALPMSRMRKGKILYTPTGAEEALYVIKEGSVRLYRLSRDGREVTVGALGVGDVFGTLPMFGSISRNTFAEASEDTLVCTIREVTLRDLIAEHPQIAIGLLRIVGERLATVEDQVEDLAFRSAEQRVARSVLRLLDDRKGPRLIVSHEQIAKSAGVARETVTKVLGALERDGVIETGYRRLRVLDRAKVEARAADR